MIHFSRSFFDPRNAALFLETGITSPITLDEHDPWMLTLSVHLVYSASSKRNLYYTKKVGAATGRLHQSPHSRLPWLLSKAGLCLLEYIQGVEARSVPSQLKGLRQEPQHSRLGKKLVTETGSTFIFSLCPQPKCGRHEDGDCTLSICFVEMIILSHFTEFCVS